MTIEYLYDITIITVVFNAADTIGKTIESVVNQEGVSIQYIVIDGGSTDGTVEIIKSYDIEITYWISEPDAGLYHAMNKGIAKATGKLVGIINADDWYAHGALQQAYELFKKNPNAVIHCDMMLVDKNGDCLYSLPAPDNPSVRAEFIKMSVNHPATFVPRHLYEQYGTFDLAYRLSSDYEFIIRLLSKSVSFVPLHKVTSYFRLGGQSGGVNTYKENFAIQRKYGRSLIAASGWFIKSLLKLSIVRSLPSRVLAFVHRQKNRSVRKASAI